MCCSLDLAELPFCFLVTHWRSLEQLSWILHQVNCRSPCLWVGIVVVQPLVMSSSLPPHCLHHARLPCPSLFSRVCSNSCPLNQWCHPTISYSVIPFSSCLAHTQSLALCIRWPKHWSFSFSIIPSNEYSELNSFRTDWFDLLGVQGTLKSLHQHHSLKASVLWGSVFFMVQVSHPSMTTGKIIALTIWTFVAKWCLSFLIQRLGLS